ncbi:hypothetical protein ACIRG5_21630 [Lentzea sp. NPDC102401]|uniref:hypothetical protein n=1 Tax=Lentzea sp. NPDC102401 TaxID=3364128 RepID=UPI00382E723D
MKVETFAAAVVGQMTGGDNNGTGLVNGEGVLLESTNRSEGGGIRAIDAASVGAHVIPGACAHVIPQVVGPW